MTTLCDPMDCSVPGSSSIGFSRQYWSGLPFPSPRDVLDTRTEPGSHALQTDSLPSEPPGIWNSVNHNHYKRKESMFIGILTPFKVGIKWAEVWRQLEHSVMHRPVGGPAHQYDYTIIYSTSFRNTV